MGTELDPVRFHLPDFRQAENLEAATVRQHGMGPAHELMQAAGSPNDVKAGPDVKMVGIAEEDLRAHLPQLPRIQCLHARLGAHRHEDRGIDNATGGSQPSQAGLRARICSQQLKHEAGIEAWERRERKN